MKTLKLLIAACLSAGTLIFLLWFTADREFEQIYRCLTQATKLTSCWQPVPFDFIANLDGLVYEGNTGNLVDRDIFLYGAYEKPILYLLRDIVKHADSNNAVFIDIGANTGQHSLFISRYVTRVHAFEPWEPVLNRFRHMVKINRISNITIYPYGLGEENSKQPFFRPSGNNLGTGSFVEGFNEQNSSAGVLEIRKGDDALAEANLGTITLIKMDIEGYEKLALTGLRRVLEKHRPFIVFELTLDPNSPVSIRNQNELSKLFPDNYQFFMISDRGGEYSGKYVIERPASELRFDSKSQHDLLAFPAEKQSTIDAIKN